jgi:Amt family ammonium transporter
VLVTIGISGVVTLVVLKAIDLTIGLRVSEEEETEGLDLVLHNERGYII